jgi:hypothetical protein
MMDIRQIRAIESANKQRWIKHFGYITDSSGIYILTREENGFRYGYVGQARRILTRLSNHLSGYQHIDLSLKKHGLYSKDNPTGWAVSCVECSFTELDEREQFLINKYANMGYQMRNKTAGGQSNGKFEIAETKERRGYRDGLKQGYKNAQKEVVAWFDKSLTFEIKGKPNKNKEKALEKFREFLGG